MLRISLVLFKNKRISLVLFFVIDKLGRKKTVKRPN